MIKVHEDRRLTLVGITHRSAAAGRRVLALLRAVGPARVLVEMSPASLAFRRGAGKALRDAIRSRLEETDPATRRAGEARELLGILALPPELRAALRYARERRGPGAPKVVLADLSRFAVPCLEELEAWAAEVEDRLAAGTDPRPFPPRQARAILPPSAEEHAEDAARECFAARAIRHALAAHPSARIVHIGGHEHLAPLAARLSDLRPRRLRLRAALAIS